MVAADSGYHKITYNSPLPMIILSSGNNLIVKLSLKTADLLKVINKSKFHACSASGLGVFGR